MQPSLSQAAWVHLGVRCAPSHLQPEKSERPKSAPAKEGIEPSSGPHSEKSRPLPGNAFAHSGSAASAHGRGRGDVVEGLQARAGRPGPHDGAQHAQDASVRSRAGWAAHVQAATRRPSAQAWARQPICWEACPPRSSCRWQTSCSPASTCRSRPVASSQPPCPSAESSPRAARPSSLSTQQAVASGSRPAGRGGRAVRLRAWRPRRARAAAPNRPVAPLGERRRGPACVLCRRAIIWPS